MAAQEQKKNYKTTKDFSGVNTKANRTAIKEDEFSWLENAQPIGHANVKVVPTVTTIGGVTFAHTVVYTAYGNIGTTNYFLAFQNDGSCEVVNLTNNIKSTMAVAGTFSNSGMESEQWNNTLVIIIDPVKGYFNWNGTNLVSVGSIGIFTIISGGAAYGAGSTATISAPNQTGGTQATVIPIITGGVVTGFTVTNAGSGYTSPPTVTINPVGGGAGANITVAITSTTGTAISSFSGRVWISSGRTVIYTAAGSATDVTSVSAGNIILNDSTLIGNITQTISANNFLYIFGTDSINVFSDVRVNTSGVTLFTNTNISASVGSDLPYALMPYFRSVVFMNRYGIYALVGSTTSKLSDALDGIFPYIDFSKPITCGPVLINNILCAAFSFTYNDPLSSPRVIQAVYFDKKWFFTSQSSITYMSSVPQNGSATLYATTGTDFRTLYTDSASAISSKIQPALLDFGDNIRDKVALKFGVEAILSSTNVNTINVTIDNETVSSSAQALTNATPIAGIVWQNNALATVTWINNALATVLWANYTLGYYLYRYDAQQWGKYIGMTITSTSPGFVISGVQYETEFRARF